VTSVGARVPHFVGVNGQPKYPVTVDYAKHTLLVHKPWRKYPESKNWLEEFYCFMNDPDCPETAKMTYERVRARHLTKTTHQEPLSQDVDHSKNPIDCDAKELLELTGLHKTDKEFDDSMLQNMDTGKDYKWDKKPQVSLKMSTLDLVQNILTILWNSKVETPIRVSNWDQGSKLAGNKVC